MKILISTSKNEHLLAPQYVKELKRLGQNVCETFYIDKVHNKSRKNLFNRLLFKLYPSIFFKGANKQLIEDYNFYRPKIVWIFKGMEIFPSTLKYLKSDNCKLINYNLDHPFNYISKASGNSNVLKSIPIYDLHLTYSQTIKNQFIKRYPSISIDVLPFGYHAYVKELEFNQKEIMAICFIGQADKERANIIQSLINSNLEVHLYGNNWTDYFTSGNLLQIYNPVEGIEYWNTLNKYRVQLNLLRSHNEDSHNMRSFEIPGSGAIMLTKKTTEHNLFFKDNWSYFSYSNDKEIIEKARYILSLSKDAASKIRYQAKKSSDHYSYFYRAKKFISILENKVHEQ